MNIRPAIYSITLCTVALAACHKSQSAQQAVPFHQSTWKINDQTYHADSTIRAYAAQTFIVKRCVTNPGDTLTVSVFFEHIPDPGNYRLMNYEDYVNNYFTEPDQFHLRVTYHNKIYRNYRLPVSCGRVDTVAAVYPRQTVLYVDNCTLENALDTTDKIQVNANLAIWSPNPTNYSENLTIDALSFVVATTGYDNGDFYDWLLSADSSTSLNISLGSSLRSPVTDFEVFSGVGIPKATSASITFISKNKIYTSGVPSQAGKHLQLVPEGNGYLVT